jgi:hypothetical protein
MLPSELKAEMFAGYPAEARRVAVSHLEAMRQLPVSFVPGLLREVIEYDTKFPAERASIDRELGQLSGMAAAELREWFQGFAKLTLSERLQSFDWVNRPAQFVEQESAYLWSTHQLDAFRQAATEYGDRLRKAAPAPAIAARRLGIAVIGQGVAGYEGPLFRKLRPYGTYFDQVKPEGGLDVLLKAVGERAKAHPEPYAHWYVDGGTAANLDKAVACVSYQGLEPVRAALLKNMQKEIARPGMGPEELRTHLARIGPQELGMDVAGDEVLNRFQVKVLTEGSGTQIFSTTFAQWTTREALRRAQPLTLLARFAPRQRQRPMNELLSGSGSDAELDYTGSLVDAEMGAYYHWINQQRLPGSETSAFLAWFEGHGQAVVIGPGMPRGTVSKSAMNLAQVLALAAG